MYSQRRYTICASSVIIGELAYESFRNYKDSNQYYFAENFRCSLAYYESENISDSSLHHIFESKNFKFPFLFEKKPNLDSEM